MRYCFDVDDTILYSDLIDGDYILKGANKELISIINTLHKEGNTIIIHTGRHWNLLVLTKKQLDKHGVMYHSVVCGKPTADYYIDDKGLTPEDFENEYKRKLQYNSQLLPTS